MNCGGNRLSVGGVNYVYHFLLANACRYALLKLCITELKLNVSRYSSCVNVVSLANTVLRTFVDLPAGGSKKLLRIYEEKLETQNYKNPKILLWCDRAGRDSLMCTRYVCMYVCMYVCIYVSMYLCMYAYVCMHAPAMKAMKCAFNDVH